MFEKQYYIVILCKTKIKIMKKVVMTMGAFFALSVATAQGGYASLSFGYAGGTSNEVLGLETDYTSALTFTEKNIEGTNGSGIPITLAGGYMFSEHLGLELGLNYFMGSEVTSSKTTTFYGDGSTTTSKGSQIRILPQLVFSTGTGSALELFGKTGIVLPVGGSTDFKVDAVNAGIPTIVEGTKIGQLSVGYTTTVGASYGISDNLSVFGELQYIGLRIKSESQIMNSYLVGGVEQISFFPTSSKETIYVDELSETSNLNITEPTEALRSTSNFNSLGINVGVKFNF